MNTPAYNFGAALAQQFNNNTQRQKQAAGGLGKAFGKMLAPGVKNLGNLPTPAPAAALTRAKIPTKPVAQAAAPAPQMGRTTLPATTQVGTTVNHKQYGKGTVQSIQDGIATSQFPNNVTRQNRVAPAAPVKTPAAKTPTAAPAPAAAPAAPTRTPSIPDRAFSAARAYGNMTGVAPTSRTGLAMFGINPLLQQGAGMLDSSMGTNFSGQDPNQTDWTSRVGQVAFPTSRAQSYLKQNLPAWLQQGQQFLQK